MLRHIAEHGDDDARETIAATLLHTARIQNDRFNTLIDEPVAHSPRKDRSVYDAAHKRTLPGRLLMDERKMVRTDFEAKEAFDYSGATYDFYARYFLRNSIDGRGMPIVSTVHYGQRFDNAMWNGKQMIYGDGDGKLFTRFTACIDVVGHELTHGVTQHEAALEYHDQPGALNEHISDAFGMMIKQQWLALKPADSDWIIGAGLFAPGIKGKGVRSMKEPGTAYNDPLLGKDPQPAHMKNYVHGADDNGGVHVNSGIPNHAFYLAATGLGDYTWKVVGRIWYETLLLGMFPQAGFQDFANATVAMAGTKYGVGGQVQTIIANAWSGVGLPVPSTLLKPGGGNAVPAPKWRDRPAAAIARD